MRKKTSSIEEDQLTSFLDLKRKADRLPSLQKDMVAVGVAFAWRAFANRFGSIKDFQSQSSQNKNQFMESLVSFHNELIVKDDQNTAAGAMMTIMYVAAALRGNKYIGQSARNRIGTI
jgi:hypothetical protein